MHVIQNVKDQNESTKEIVVNDNKENKHIVQHINEPEEEVLVENNTNKDKELDTPDTKKHDVDNEYKDDEDIQHYNDEFKDDTSREESEIATPTRKEGRSRRPPPDVPPHKIFWPQESGRDNKRHPNYKPQNTIFNKKYVCLPEFRCGFLQGREVRC